MNERIRELAVKAGEYVNSVYTPPVRSKEPGKIWEAGHVDWHTQFNQKFAELIVRECCLALWTEECHTSDLAFDEVKRNATKIKEHFGIDPNEITEDMLARSIKWMEQQLEDKKHFGVK
jgi:hypothetical protein